MKLAIIFGTRPEAIKQAPIVLEARRRGAEVEPVLISTGQHREMLRPILDLFGIEPDENLDLMRPDQSPGAFAARALEQLDDALARHRPDAVVVQGDTTTAMIAGLAAFYRRIPVAHVEAGLRTDRLDAPFPEELNRRVIAQLARWHFAPTPSARANLLREGIDRLGGTIAVTGNTGIDALFHALERIRERPPSHPLLEEVRGRRIVLVTGHRRENFGEPFREFCLGLRDIAEAHPDVLVVYPVHLNPGVQQPVHELLGDCANIRLGLPADYPVFVALMQSAELIVTDSGGVQEEAPVLGKPVLVTRDVTERPEAVEAGAVRLVGPHRRAIFDAAHRLLTGEEKHVPLARDANPYGDGRAAARCLDFLLHGAGEEFRGK